MAEALRLADALTQPTYPDWVMHIPAPWHPPAQETREAAAELRRLHEAHDWQYKMAGERLRRIEKLEAQRDALLEALRQIVEQHGQWNNGIWAANIARAAIKAVEETK